MLSKLLTLSGTAVAMIGLVGCAQPNGALSTQANDSAIIGGADATGSEDFAKLTVGLYNLQEGFSCTGVLISNEFLLTAAHCVSGDPRATVVVFDKLLMSTLKKEVEPIIGADGSLDVEKIPVTGALRRVTAYRVSPVYPVKQKDLFNNGDIAIVKFAGGLAPGFQRASVLANSELLADGQTVLLAGYGHSDGVKKTGSGTLRFVETTIRQAKFTASEILIEQSHGKGACQGDSGGPAFASIDGKKFVIGVTSRGGYDDVGNTCGVSAIYTGVSFYAKWIVAAVKELNTSTSDKVLPLPAPEKKPALPAPSKVADAS